MRCRNCGEEGWHNERCQPARSEQLGIYTIARRGCDQVTSRRWCLSDMVPGAGSDRHACIMHCVAIIESRVCSSKWATHNMRSESAHRATAAIHRTEESGGRLARSSRVTGHWQALYCAYLRQRDVPACRRTCRERKDEARLMGEYELGWVQLDGKEIGEGQK